MNAAEEIKNIKKTLEDLRAQGQETVSINRLIQYLGEVEGLAVADVANQKAAQQKFENDCEIAKLRSPHEVEMFKSVIEAGLNALKSAIVINGGAAVALLAFVGGQITKYGPNDQKVLLSCFGYSLLAFIIGTGSAGMASGARYLAQFSYARALDSLSRGSKSTIWLGTGHTINVISVLLGLASFASFFVGGYLSYEAILAYTRG